MDLPPLDTAPTWTSGPEPRTLDPELVAALDPGIRLAVQILVEAGIETFESCEGGEGHSYPEPTIRFSGERPEGFKALSAAMYDSRIKVSYLRRIWTIRDGEPTGPYWELVFVPTKYTAGDVT